MQILNNLFGPHANNLNQAMSRTSERHQLLTTNLANVNTPGYKRKDIDFGIMLEQENKNLLSKDAAPRVDRGSVRIDGNSVDMEKEVMAIAETELRYQALTDMTSRYFAGLKNVIREGR